MVIYPQFAFVFWWFKMLENSFVPYLLFSFIKEICHFLKFTQNIKKSSMKNIPNSQFMYSHEFLICILYLKEVVFCLFFFSLFTQFYIQYWEILLKRNKNETVEVPCVTNYWEKIYAIPFGRGGCWAHVIYLRGTFKYKLYPAFLFASQAPKRQMSICWPGSKVMV